MAGRSEVMDSKIPRLEMIVSQQQQLSVDLTALVTGLNAQLASETIHGTTELEEATQQALERMKIAVSDLQQSRFEQSLASQRELQRSLNETVAELGNHHDWAATIGWITIITLLLWKAFGASRLKFLPAPLAAISLATIVAAILNLPVQYVDVPNNLWSELRLFSPAVLTSVPFGVVLQAGVVLAVVASAETLLCATAVDQMHLNARANYDKELAAQGIGNIVCGLLGALPMTGVIVRSAANVEAGARTRLATILHGFWLLLFVAGLAMVLRMIPTAALAAMLVYTGFKLINIKAVIDLKQYRLGRGNDLLRDARRHCVRGPSFRCAGRHGIVRCQALVQVFSSRCAVERGGRKSQHRIAARGRSDFSSSSAAGVCAGTRARECKAAR